MMSAEERDQWDKDNTAPAGAVWVCAACGKRSSRRDVATIDRMWDESCFLNSVLCDEKSLVFTGGRVSYAEPMTQTEKAQ